MNFEKSCGAVVYRKSHGNNEICLIRHAKSGHWSFPKGHTEGAETEEETASREIKEETGLEVYLDNGFRETVTYFPKKDTSKTVVYFLAKSKRQELHPQAGEIYDIRWVEIKHAVRFLAYESERRIVKKVIEFISRTKW